MLHGVGACLFVCPGTCELMSLRDLVPLRGRGEVHSPRAQGNVFSAGVHRGGILHRLDWRWGCPCGDLTGSGRDLAWLSGV